jgi:NADPH-dependent 2,4-dienoyl-CoA reductase/sulfur reductase-like enzyme
MRDVFDVVIVGAGPAGLAAARRASECGVRVALVDDNPAPGGQIWRGKAVNVPDGVKLFCGARVVAAPAPNRLTFETFDSAFDLDYRAVVVATGARELFLPFPGWTLPHVAGAGGLQALVKSGMPIAGKRVIVAGSGPLLFAVADYLRKRGADVPFIAEQADGDAVRRFGLTLVRYPGKFLDALRLRARFRYLTSTYPVAAEPGAVTLRRDGKTWTERCDFLACGFGLVPNTELLHLLGPETANVWPAGEVTGIGGLELSIVEGEIAGLKAAGEERAADALTGRLMRHRRFADALASAFALRPELSRLAADDTIVCRCEDARLGAIRAATSWREAKLHTRCGMGACQGRVCGPAVERILGWKSESVRPPLFPARIGTLSTEDSRADVRRRSGAD